MERLGVPAFQRLEPVEAAEQRVLAVEDQGVAGGDAGGVTAGSCWWRGLRGILRRTGRLAGRADLIEVARSAAQVHVGVGGSGSRRYRCAPLAARGRGAIDVVAGRAGSRI